MSPPDEATYLPHHQARRRDRASLRGRDRTSARSGDATPSPPRPLSPFPGTPSRPTVSTSSVSVSTRVDSSPRRSRVRTTSSAAATGSSSAAALLYPSSAMSPGSSDSGRASPAPSALSVPPSVLSAASVGSVSSSRVSSRKGKERAGDDGDVEQDAEMEAVSEDARAAGPPPTTAGSTDVRRGLRELVERDRPRGGLGGHTRAASSRDVHTLASVQERPFSPRRYYVLTNAGKPVLSLGHPPDDCSTVTMMGVVQSLISIFAEDDDRPRSIIRGQTQITFVLKPQLYLFAVSDWGEPEYVLRMHLEYIYLQILSVVSSTQISRAFQRRSNFDLSRLLEGSDRFLHKIAAQCQDDLSFFTTTLQPMRMAPALRDTAASALMPPAKFKDLLYVLLIAGGHIVTLLRPRRHAVHPSDMHLLLNTLATSETLRTVETWLPICLPKFNPAGFVHAYISFVREDVGLVFVSADRDAFEPLCGWRESVVEQLDKDGALDKIQASVKSHPYSVAAVGSPGLRHFVYKSRGLTQLTAPEWEEPYGPASVDRKRLVTLYERVQDTLFARSGQAAPLKLVYMANAHEAVLGWLTKPFELYIAVSPHLPMNAVVSTANRVAKWVNAEESRVFLKDAPVF